MKISMYELLGLVKDGKAPKKVKYKDKIYYYHEGYDFNYMYNSSDYMPMDEDKSLFTFPSYKPKDGVMCWDNNTAIDFLNDEVEIIEDTIEDRYREMEKVRNYKPNPSYLPLKEEKKIPEKLPFECGKISDNDFLAKYISQNRKAINEIIDYLKSKGE